MAHRYQHNHLEGQDGDVIEDGDPTELQGQVENLIELSMRMTEVVKSTSEWMASKNDIPKNVSTKWT